MGYAKETRRTVKNCIICGKEFQGPSNQKMCSKECSKIRHKGFQRCPECGELFYNHIIKHYKNKRDCRRFNKHRIFCSVKCQKKYHTRIANQKNKERYKNDEDYRNKVKGYIKRYNASTEGKDMLQANKLKRDHRIKNHSQVDSITLRELFKKDNGICWLCGCTCDYEDKEYRISKKGKGYLATGPNYPSVDHVVPLSKGGTHTWNNVKLAHKSCNSRKRDKLVFTAEFFNENPCGSTVSGF